MNPKLAKAIAENQETLEKSNLQNLAAAHMHLEGAIAEAERVIALAKAYQSDLSAYADQMPKTYDACGPLRALFEKCQRLGR